MKYLVLIAAITFSIISCTRKVYVVRHAEKIAATDSLGKLMINDLPLSEAGKVRAIVLKEQLNGEKIRHIYSTNFSRTKNTADPLSRAINVPVEIYNNIDSLVSVVKTQKGNTLIVGHSNTVDDIINKLTGEKKLSDLKDFEYDNLYVVRIRGKKTFFKQRKFGYPSNP